MSESRSRREPSPDPRPHDPKEGAESQGRSDAPLDSFRPADGGTWGYARRVLIAVLIGLGLVLLALFVWYAVYVLLLAFAGILVAVLLRGLADWVSRKTRLSPGWSLAAVIVALALGFVGLFWLMAPSVAEQVDKFRDRLPQAVQTVEGRMMRYGWGRQLLGRPDPEPGGEAAPGASAGQGPGSVGPEAAPQAGQPGQEPGQAAESGNPPAASQPTSQPASQPATQPGKGSGGVVTKAVSAVTGQTGSVFTTVKNFVFGTFNALVAVVVILVVGIYLAATPDLYLRGLLHLMPQRKRHRVREVLHAVGHSLRWWLIGQGVTMLVIGVLTAVGLKLIGIELWLALGLLAALFNFIPNFGPLISFIPALLFALASSPGKAAGVLVLYVVAQGFEGYVLTPLVQKKAVDLPPALLILTQVLMGILAGPIGVVLAAPLTAAALVVVQMLYVRDALGDPVHPDDEQGQPAGAGGG